jgi:hypothetical protein
MKLRILASVFTLVMFIAVLPGPAGATLSTIGTATYNGTNYYLIYDDNPSGPIVWFDYTNYPNTAPQSTWPNQVDWASSLNNPGVLTYNLLPG